MLSKASSNASQETMSFRFRCGAWCFLTLLDLISLDYDWIELEWRFNAEKMPHVLAGNAENNYSSCIRCSRHFSPGASPSLQTSITYHTLFTIPCPSCSFPSFISHKIYVHLPSKASFTSGGGWQRQVSFISRAFFSVPFLAAVHP